MQDTARRAALLDAALSYAARGWHVFPCQPGQKTPASSHGLNDATCDAERIREYWARFPDANVAVNCGLSGLVVVDVDMKAGADGLETWRELRAKHSFGDETTSQITPNSGEHCFYSANGATVRSSVGRLGPGLDIRATGGYVLLPPSQTERGEYVWQIGYSPNDVTPVPLPAALVALLTAAPSANGHIATVPVADAIPVGQRNTRLASLAGSLRRRGVSEDAICTALTAENAARCVPPLDGEEVRRIAASVSRYAPVPDAAPTTMYRLTDYGNSERLAAGHGGDLRYCFAWGGWLTWDGAVWRRDDMGEAERRGKQTARRIYLEAAECQDRETAHRTAKWATESESKPRIAAMLSLAQSEPGIAVRPADLDADPWQLNCQNGTIDLRTGQLREHRREDLLTKMTGAEYDPNAEAPLFERFLGRILPDRAVREYVQTWGGYALTGVTREHRLPVWWGSGGNGKSTLVGALLGALGDYGRQSAPELLVASDHAEHPTALADLFGARLVATVEVGEGKRLAETLVKTISGGDRMKARFMRQDYFEWEPTHKLALVCNHLPHIRGTDEGVWRRIDLVPFTETIPGPEQDTALPEKLRAEYSGILAWLVRGCQMWQSTGLGRPEAVRVANERYRAEQDVLADFITDRCILKPRASVTVKELYTAYLAWCEANGEKPGGKRAFTQRLRDRGIADERTNRARSYRGVGLREDMPEVTDGDRSPVSFLHEPAMQKVTGHLSPSVTFHVASGDDGNAPLPDAPTWPYDVPEGQELDRGDRATGHG